MRATSMSFFKTAKSTFMSTNDLQSDNQLTDLYRPQSVAKGGTGHGDEEDDESDLAGNAEQIVVGSSMSILRRRGRQNKENRHLEREG